MKNKQSTKNGGLSEMEARIENWEHVLETIGRSCSRISNDLCELTREKLGLALGTLGANEEFLVWIGDVGLTCETRADVQALHECFHSVHGPDSLWVDPVDGDDSAAGPLGDPVIRNAFEGLAIASDPQKKMRALILDNALEAVEISLERIDPKVIPYKVMIRAYHVRALLGSVLERSKDIQFTEGGEDK